MEVSFVLVLLFINGGNQFIATPGFDTLEACNKSGVISEVWRDDYRYTEHVWHRCVQASSIEEAIRKAQLPPKSSWIAHHDDSKGYFK